MAVISLSYMVYDDALKMNALKWETGQSPPAQSPDVIEAS